MMQQCTGHCSIKALRLYERTSVLQEKAFSPLIAEEGGPRNKATV